MTKPRPFSTLCAVVSAIALFALAGCHQHGAPALATPSRAGWVTVQPGVQVKVKAALTPMTAKDFAQYKFMFAGGEKRQWVAVTMTMRNDTTSAWVPVATVQDMSGATLWNGQMLMPNEAADFAKVTGEDATKTVEVSLHYPVPASTSLSDLVLKVGAMTNSPNPKGTTSIRLGQ